MVLGLLTAIAACPAIIGTTEAIRQGERQNKREEHRGRKSNLTVTLLRQSSYNALFNGAKIVLKDAKLYVDVRKPDQQGSEKLHPFEGYFLPYPDMGLTWKGHGFRKGEGLVTTINEDNFLNWIFLDRDTHEIKHGVREVSDAHVAGPWDVTNVDRRLTLEGWEGFIAVEEEEDSGLWALYFDRADDGLKSKDQPGTQDKRMLEVELWRKEMRHDRIGALEDRAERIQARNEAEAST